MIAQLVALTAQPVLDPAEVVHEAVRLVFRLFTELGTVNAVLRALVTAGIQLPVRVREGPDKGDLTWRRPARPGRRCRTCCAIPPTPGSTSTAAPATTPAVAGPGIPAAAAPGSRTPTGWSICPTGCRPTSARPTQTDPGPAGRQPGPPRITRRSTTAPHDQRSQSLPATNRRAERLTASTILSDIIESPKGDSC